MDSKRFTGKEGSIISAEQAQKLIEPHLSKERTITANGENFVKAEFFGIHTFNQLMGKHGDNCVGFRIYYGVGEDEDNSLEKVENSKYEKKPTSRLIIVPVDENGRDLTKTAQLGGMKDMPAEGEVMVGGPICPRHC
ncbi:hypothetical protein [Dyadobacter sp. CY323]|uniref:hypothetical protein n=1 Tax=Dyadobacter sp. CY323 TaxID=2907302 RepID=UPI001F342D8E|nr:hypothetical protein [Dyadobacter sp. CY323]MCE6990463.1 hypothetical protein [Dyadobacter sp. CY323]